MELTNRHRKIINIVKTHQPISGDQIAGYLGLSKSTLRSDLAVLTMVGILAARPNVGYIYQGEDKQQATIQDQFKTKLVEDLLTKAVLIDQTNSIEEAIQMLFINDTDTLFVTDASKLIGSVSKTDLLRALVMGDQRHIAVAVIMTATPELIVVTPQTTALDAASLLVENKLDTVAVVESSSDLKVVGKLSKTHLIDLIINLGGS